MDDNGQQRLRIGIAQVKTAGLKHGLVPSRRIAAPEWSWQSSRLQD